MKLRFLCLTTLFSASLFAAGANAHDPSLHELPAPKVKPTTCAELADTKRFAAELAEKALTTKCEAEARSAKKDERAEAADKDE